MGIYLAILAILNVAALFYCGILRSENDELWTLVKARGEEIEAERRARFEACEQLDKRCNVTMDALLKWQNNFSGLIRSVQTRVEAIEHIWIRTLEDESYKEEDEDEEEEGEEDGQ